jgi:hypothetical protein
VEDSLHDIKLYTKGLDADLELIKDGNTGNFDPGKDSLHDIHGDVESNQVDLELIKDGGAGSYIPSVDNLHDQRIANETNFSNIDTDLGNIGVDLEEIKGVGFDTDEDSLKKISDKVDENQADIELIKGSSFVEAEDNLHKQTEYISEVDSKVDRIMDGSTGAFVDAEDNLHALSTDVGNIETNVTNIGDDLSEIKGAGFDTATDSLEAISDKMPDLDVLKRLLGLSHENTVIDNTNHDADNQLLTARMRVYDSKTNADAATDGGSETTGLIATYMMTSDWDGVNRLGFFRMTLEP